MKKKLLLFIILGIFLIGSITALAYFYLTLNMSFSISEPLSVQYSFVHPLYSCTEYNPIPEFNPNYTNAVNPFILPYAYPGEEKKICFKIVSKTANQLNVSLNLTGDWNSLVENVVISNSSIASLVNENSSTYLWIKYTIKPESNGTFNAGIRFSRS